MDTLEAQTECLANKSTLTRGRELVILTTQCTLLYCLSPSPGKNQFAHLAFRLGIQCVNGGS